MRSLSRSSLSLLLLGLICFVPSLLLTATPLCISEFMASNTRTLTDEDGDFPDWIELHNTTSEPVSLLGWSLTTDPKLRGGRGWSFPATNLGPGEFLVVFASGKNRTKVGAPLHTHFKLSREGETVALLSPTGTIADGSFLTPFPPQVPDVSYGRGKASEETILVETNALYRLLVPRDSSADPDWILPAFDDGAWRALAGTPGYDVRTPSPATLHSLIRNDLRSELFARGTGIYLRIPFVVDHPENLEELSLQIHYSDGYMAWINGVAVAGAAVPDPIGWNSQATETRDSALFLKPEPVVLSPEALRSMRPGTNWLAVQGLNSASTNAQFILRPQLIGSRATSTGEQLRYFTAPTPGTVNALGSRDLGPILYDLSDPPATPSSQDPIVLSIRALPAFTNIASVELRVRVMFDAEQSIPMTDDGRQADQQARDGLYTARIPPFVARPGQMIRWYVVAKDVTGHVSRYPTFDNPVRAPAYAGTMMLPSSSSALSTFHWFVQDFRAADTFQGTRCSVYFAGELYDNVLVRLRGFGSTLYPKHSYKFDFNPGQWFRFDPKESRVEEINLNSTSSDQSYVRPVLSWETYREAGSPYCVAFPMRVQTNSQFYSVATFVEQPDATMLRRNGLNPNGTLYKIFSNLSTVGASEKKQPADTDFTDLQELIDGIAGGNLTYLYDHLNLPAFINYLAVTVLLHDNDCVGKNYYLYRDPRGTGEWLPIPWDKDLTFGENFSNGVTETLWANFDTARDVLSTHPGTSPSHPLFMDRKHQKYNGDWNRLVDEIYRTPELRDMYLRRLRTLMDRFLQSPETPPDALRYERRLAELLQQVGPDAALDRLKHGSMFAKAQDMGTAAFTLHSQYLALRRIHFFVTHNETNSTRKIDSARIPEPAPPNPEIQFGFVERARGDGNRDWEYLELFNPNTVAIDLSGWELRGNIQHTLAPGTVLPAAGTLYVVANAAAFRHRTQSPKGGEGLFVQGNYMGELGARAGFVELWEGSRKAQRVELEDRSSAAQQSLRVVRVHYHPSPSSVLPLIDPNELEYVELRNTGSLPLPLAGVRFAAGIHFEFTLSGLTEIPAPEQADAPERSIFVVKNRKAFEQHYGQEPRIAGEFTGQLDNSGEPLRLEDGKGQVIQEFRYDPSWWPMTDGRGFALIHDPLLPLETWNVGATWRMGLFEGDPGFLPAATPSPEVAAVTVNEILANPIAGLPEGIELLAPMDADISGWFLSDDLDEPRKYQFPAGTQLKAGEHRVVAEFAFGLPTGLYPGFHLDQNGDGAYLFSATPDGRLTGYFHGVRFGPSPQGSAYGRHFDSQGGEHWILQPSQTLGFSNALPNIGPLVISEIHYRPTKQRNGTEDRDGAFIEIHNSADESLTLFNPFVSGKPWRVRGDVDFDFPIRLVIPARSEVLLVGFDPDRSPAKAKLFRARYGVDPQIQIFGPWRGSLPLHHGSIRLEGPVTLAGGTQDWVTLDEFDYRGDLPGLEWADGQGASLNRGDLNGYGGDSSHWFVSAPNPGNGSFPLSPPVILIQPRSFSQPAAALTLLSVLADSTTELHYQWRKGGEPIVGATNSVLRMERPTPADSGEFDVLVMSRGGVSRSESAAVTFIPTPIVYVQPQIGNVVSGSNYTLRVIAEGTPPVSYQWLRNGTNLPEAITAELPILNARPEQEGIYSVVIRDANAPIESVGVTVKVLFPPTILRAPESQMVNLGQSIRLGVRATGTPPLTYLWRKNGRFYQATTEPSLIIPKAVLTNAGPYAVVVSNLVTTVSRGVITPEANVLVLSDTDGDGMPDIWELTYQFRFDDPSDAAQDADFDGMTNLEEYLAGTDPRDPSDSLRILKFAPTPGLLGQGLLSFSSISNRSYTLQYSAGVGTVWSNWLSFPAYPTNLDVQLSVPLVSPAERLYRLVTPRLTDPEFNPQ